MFSRLAVSDRLIVAEQSDNGWAANYHLMTVIAAQLARRSHQNGKVKVTDDDGALHLLYRLAVEIDLDYCDDDAEDREAAKSCWNVLAALGFVEKGEGKHGGIQADAAAGASGSGEVKGDIGATVIKMQSAK